MKDSYGACRLGFNMVQLGFEPRSSPSRVQNGSTRVQTQVISPLGFNVVQRTEKESGCHAAGVGA